MIIREVRLVNVFSHENTKVSFPDGVISIVGPNGAGKSSIIDAIYIALFAGSNIDVRGGNKEYIVTRGKTKGEISVIFEVSGRNYSVTRKIPVKGSAEAYLFELDSKGAQNPKARGIDAVVREVGNILGLRGYNEADLRKLVKATIIARQDELTSIIDAGGAERREWILSLLGLSYLESALDTVKEIVREEKVRAEEGLRAKNEMILQLERELKGKERTLSEAIAQLSDLSRKREELRGGVERLRERVAKADEALEIAKNLRSAILQKRAAELRDLVERLSPLRSWRGDIYESTSKEIQRLESEAKRLEEELAAAIAEAGKSLGSPIRDSEELESALKELDKRIEELNKRRGELEGELGVFEDIISELKITDHCPVCGSKISDPLAVRSHILNEIGRIEEELVKIKGELAELKDMRERASEIARRVHSSASSQYGIIKLLEDKKRELEEVSRTAEELCRSLGTWRGDIGECVNSLNELKKRFEEASIEYGMIDKLVKGTPALDADTLLNELNSRLTELDMGQLSSPTSERVDEVVKSLEEMKRRLNNELGELEKKLNELENRIAKLEGERGTIEKEIELRKGKLEQLSKDVVELRRKAERISLLGKLGESFLGKNGIIAKSLTKKVREELEKRANRVLSKLQLPNITIDEYFDIYVKAAGDIMPIANASGGERVGIALALRLALAEIIMGKFPASLIIDEPTVYLDEERRQSMFEIISELGKTLKQMIVVTHDEAVMNISDKVIEVEKVGGVSRVSYE